MNIKRKTRARHKKSDIKVVEAVFSTRVAQERIMHDCLKRMIVGDDADLVLATTPIDVMFARKIEGRNGLSFNTDHHKAGEWFQRLFRYHAPGRCRLRGVLDDGQYSNDTNPENPHRDAEYLALTTDPRWSREALSSLEDVIVFGITPKWLLKIITSTVQHDYEVQARYDFIDALELLKTIWIEFDKYPTEALWQKIERQTVVLDRASFSLLSAIAKAL